MKIRIIKYIAPVLLGILTLTAEAQFRHEFSAGAGFGRQDLKYHKSKNNNFGYDFGLGYDFFFTKNFGLGTGAELSFYKGNINSFNFQSSQIGLKDYQNDVFNYNSAVTGYNEEQNATLLNIPLMLRYQTSGNNKFYISGGTKIAIPVKGTYKAYGAKYVNTGEYTGRGVTLDEPEFMGFGTFTDKSFEGDLNLNTSIIASAETGIKWSFGKLWSLYSGVYVDYGLTDMIDGNRNKSIVTYSESSPIDFNNASILTSAHYENDAQKAFTDKVIPVSFGVKLRIAFGTVNADKPKLSVVESAIKYDTAEREAEEARRRAAEEAEKQRIAAEAEAKRKADEYAEKERLARVEANRKAEELRSAKTEITRSVAGYTVNGTALSDEKKAELDKKIELLKKYPELTITCEGYTCDLGSERINESIGLKRAEAAKDYLLQNGIEESKITAVSKGKSNPVTSNDNEENRRKNRRVEFSVQ